MVKEIKYSMGKIIFEMASKPLRSKKDVILLLLNTIKMLEVDGIIPENNKVEVAIIINKMNRIFYILEDKIFSVQFPFKVEIEAGKITRIYDDKTGLNIDSMLISTLIGIIDKSNIDHYSIDQFFDEIFRSEDNLQNVVMDQLWEILKFILSYDLGYIRYDYDEKHKKELLHPVNHLDICLDTAATYKIGLEKTLDFEVFKDILDTTTNCFFLKI